MCTATWLMQADSYELFCNRDESRKRRPALPPALLQRAGVNYIAPIDADAGGSWIAVNESGLSLCLLNYYPTIGQEPSTISPPSRGLLLISLINQRSPSVDPTALEAYRPFLLLVLAPRQEPRLWCWNGRNLESETPQMPVTTSSFDPERVVAHRRAMFTRVQGEAYHVSHDPAGGAYSVCMTRADAQTVSFSHIIVGPEQIEFEYKSLAPEEIATRMSLLRKNW